MRMIVIGTGGLAKQCLGLLEKSNVDLIFVDNTEGAKPEFFGYPVVNSYEAITSGGSFGFIIAIGDPKWRYHFYNELKKRGGTPLTLMDDTCDDSRFHRKEEGNIILGQTLIEPNVIIGKGNLINYGAALFHDSVIGDFNEIMPGSKLLGNCKIGSHCRIGTNAVILPHTEVCDSVVIGSGAVVTKNITEPGTYVGVPARKR